MRKYFLYLSSFNVGGCIFGGDNYSVLKGKNLLHLVYPVILNETKKKQNKKTKKKKQKKQKQKKKQKKKQTKKKQKNKHINILKRESLSI